MNPKTHRPQRRALTPRERKILALAAADRRDKEIATALGISEHTVHNHWAHIYDKLGVHSRVAAVARWLRKTGMT